MTFLIENLATLKDIFYLIGSVLAIVAFVMTIRKRDKSMFTFRTEMGNESRPLLICVRGNMYNVNIYNNGVSYYAHRLPSSFKFSSVRRNEFDLNEYDESSFYACLQEGEALLIDNEKLNLNLKIKYEDQFRNKYFQTFELIKSEIGNPKRLERNRSQSLYDISKRKKRLLWIWH